MRFSLKTSSIIIAIITINSSVFFITHKWIKSYFNCDKEKPFKRQLIKNVDSNGSYEVFRPREKNRNVNFADFIKITYGELQLKKKPMPYNVDLTLWPENDSKSDRIFEQILYQPFKNLAYSEGSRVYLKTSMRVKLKIILLIGIPFAKQEMLDIKSCGVNNYYLTSDVNDLVKADAVVFNCFKAQPDKYHVKNRPPGQIWLFYCRESPFIAPLIKYPDVFNWTSTYSIDSDIVLPWGKFLYGKKFLQISAINYTLEKTKTVVWFVSKCVTFNSRLEYAKELSKYIQVDIFGKCGTKSCVKKDEECLSSVVKDYKFYLAFENSNCRHYITEKFFSHALRHNLVPVVMGAPKEDYLSVSPQHSFIHVDDFETPEKLAEYLKFLDGNDDEYHKYFEWKNISEVTTEIPYFCRICAMLQSKPRQKTYENINQWHGRSEFCTFGSWRRNENNRANPTYLYTLNDFSERMLVP